MCTLVLYYWFTYISRHGILRPLTNMCHGTVLIAAYLRKLWFEKYATWMPNWRKYTVALWTAGVLGIPSVKAVNFLPGIRINSWIQGMFSSIYNNSKYVCVCVFYFFIFPCVGWHLHQSPNFLLTSSIMTQWIRYRESGYILIKGTVQTCIVSEDESPVSGVHFCRPRNVVDRSVRIV